MTHPTEQMRELIAEWRKGVERRRMYFGEDTAAKVFDRCANELESLLSLTDRASEGLRERVRTFLEIDPFQGGRDSDECLWCRRMTPRGLSTWQESHLPQYHDEDCELVLLDAALAQPAAGEGEQEIIPSFTASGVKFERITKSEGGERP